MPSQPSAPRSRSLLRARLIILGVIFLPPILFVLSITIFSAVNQIPDELLQPPPDILLATPSSPRPSLESSGITSGAPPLPPTSTLAEFDSYEDYLASIPHHPGGTTYLSIHLMLDGDEQGRALYRTLSQPGLTQEKIDALQSSPALIPAFLELARAGGAPAPSQEELATASGIDLLRASSIVPDLGILRLGVQLLMAEATLRLKAGNHFGAADYISAAFTLADTIPRLNMMGLQASMSSFMHVNESLASCIAESTLTAPASASIREIMTDVPERSIKELRAPAVSDYRIDREFFVDELTASFVNKWSNAAGFINSELRIGRDPMSWVTATIDTPKDAILAFTSGFAEASRMTAHGEEWLRAYDELFGAAFRALEESDLAELERVSKIGFPPGPQFFIWSTSDNMIFFDLAQRQLANQALFNINLAALDCLALFADSTNRPSTDSLAAAIASHKDPFTGAPLLYDLETGAVTIRSSAFDPADSKSRLNTIRLRMPFPPLPPRHEADE